jgi:3,5-epimerase/4-reductase
MAKNTMLIVEPRNLPGLASIINKFRETLGNNWTYVFYCGMDAKDYWATTNLHKEIEVRALDVTNFPNHCEYSDFMKSKKLWESLDGEFVLTIQADCWLINEGKYTIDYFIKKNVSYIGGNMCYDWYELDRENIHMPYKNLNGGLSLRKRADMLKVIEAYPPTQSAWSNLLSAGLTADAEDVYFAIGCIKLGLPIGDDEDSSHFSLHAIYKDDFFGMHQPRKEFCERLNQKFPELKYKNPYLKLVDYTDWTNKNIKESFVDKFINMAMPMNVLVYGGKGWIGQQFIQVLKHANIQFVVGASRADNYDTLLAEIAEVSPTHVVSFIGRTHGTIGEKVYTTIDYLEQEGKLVENVRDNLYSPLLLSMICREKNVHYTYLGTGCIFKFDEEHPFGKEQNGFHEGSQPNFFGSSYSIVKGFTDKLMQLFEKDVLNLRIRMPITGEKNGRNFITKIATYPKVCSVPNSMSVLPELLPYVLEMMKQNITGTMNLTNPGLISHNEILEMYKEIVDPSFKWNNFSMEEQRAILAADRSNNYLDTSKLEALFPGIDNIKVAVRKCLIAYKNKESNNYNDDMKGMYINMSHKMKEMHEEIPVIIHHTGGNQDYLQSCVKINSQTNKVYLIGDDANKTAYANNKNVEHVHINDLANEEVEDFKRHFVNYSSNTQSFEMNGIVRVFYIKQLILKKRLNRVFLVDSDCIVLDNITNIMKKCPNLKIGYSIQTFNQESNPFHMTGCIHNTLMNLDFCNKYIGLCFDVYKTRTKFHLIEPKVNHHKTHAGGICDMTMGYLCYATNVFSEPLSNLNDIFVIDGEECTFDHNINDPYGYLGVNTYQTEWNDKISRWCDVKKIDIANNKYYATTHTGKRIRLLTLHYQGGAKEGLARL